LAASHVARRERHRVLPGGRSFQRLTLDARRDLVLTAGDAAAIVMTLNGALAKSLGRPGETITARISRTNFKHYLLP
jgi:hypothetical protein